MNCFAIKVSMFRRISAIQAELFLYEKRYQQTCVLEGANLCCAMLQCPKKGSPRAMKGELWS